jgi:hypothetical protein
VHTDGPRTTSIIAQSWRPRQDGVIKIGSLDAALSAKEDSEINPCGSAAQARTKYLLWSGRSLKCFDAIRFWMPN